MWLKKKNERVWCQASDKWIFTALQLESKQAFLSLKVVCNCSLHHPCDFLVPSALHAFIRVSNYACLPLWHTLSTQSCLHSTHVRTHTDTSVSAFLCSSVWEWSLQCKNTLLIPIVMISTEAGWSCFKTPSCLLGHYCCINKKLAHYSVEISPFLSVCMSSQKCQHPEKGSFANTMYKAIQLHINAFSKNLPSTVEA